eukprot:c39797_g1_i1.p1 GENE.c39797_g1_i1~~c39797_g1_i1.p1  ORF type:complete len:374 (+),score=45.87 c39797_g1_i1:36-1157(+)
MTSIAFPPSSSLTIAATTNSVSVSLSSSSPTPCRVFLRARLAVGNRSTDWKNETLVSDTSRTEPFRENSLSFNFLPPNVTFSLSIEGRNDPQEEPVLATKCEVKTKAQIASGMSPQSYIGSDHIINSWVMDAPGDWLWTTFPTGMDSDDGLNLLTRVFECALFSLPSPFARCVPLINPESRFCIDLALPIAWKHNKKIRRHGRDFTLSLNVNFDKAFERARECHTVLKGSTWITADLQRTFSRMVHDPNSRIQLAAFELWEGTELVAVVMGFGVGMAWHDYTMCTFRRDHRSLGAILTRCVGHILTLCGYKFWYWGVENEYMAEYHTKGGSNFERKEFWQRWSEVAKLPNQSLSVICDAIREGRALLQPKHGW